MVPVSDYVEARNLLETNFGNGIKITNAYMEKALNWPSIKPAWKIIASLWTLIFEDVTTPCKILNNWKNLTVPPISGLLSLKLPYNYREKWRSMASDVHDRQGRAKFIDLVLFIEKQAAIVLDPLYGDIQDPVVARKVLLKTTKSSITVGQEALEAALLPL